jgi:uncharacterized membrane protein YfcA
MNELNELKFDNFLYPTRRRAARRRRTKRIRMVFGLVAWIGGVAAGVYIYNRVSSWILGVFTFFMLVHIVGRGIPDVITDPHKIQRALFFTLLPVASTGVLYFTYRWWDRMWLSVLLGLIVGGTLNTVVGALLFPRIFQEEQEDSQQRMEEAWQ